MASLADFLRLAPAPVQPLEPPFRTTRLLARRQSARNGRRLYSMESSTTRAFEVQSIHRRDGDLQSAAAALRRVEFDHPPIACSPRRIETRGRVQWNLPRHAPIETAGESRGQVLSGIVRGRARRRRSRARLQAGEILVVERTDRRILLARGRRLVGGRGACVRPSSPASWDFQPLFPFPA